MNVPPLWFLALLGFPLAVGISYWLSNRPERHADLKPGETELDFGERDEFSFRISYEYLAEFLYELRKKFENGWSLGQVATLLNKVVDGRAAEWTACYVVTAAGASGQLNLHFRRMDCDGVHCRIIVPQLFTRIVGRTVQRYPVKVVGRELGVGS